MSQNRIPQPEHSMAASATIDLSLVSKRQSANGEVVESWELLDRLITRGMAKAVGYHMHTGVKYVQAWCREPEGEGGSGQPNPIDRVCHLIAAIFLFNPLGAAFIPEFITNYHRQLVRTHQAVGFDSGERKELAADLLRRGVEAVNSLNIEGATEPTLQQLIELIEVAIQAKEKIQAELQSRPHETRMVTR